VTGVIVYCRDGRIFDVTGLSPTQMVEKLRAEHVPFDGIEKTVHYLGSIAFTCPQCGRVSYNRNDALHRYCGFCKTFIADGRR
jgi:hypothetical protein